MAVVLGILTLLTAIVVWASLNAARSSSPVYGNVGSAVARTWTWDGTDFSAQPSTGSGPFSSDSDMAFDRHNRVVVLWDHGCSRLAMGFTGGCQSVVDRTWTWDGQAWIRQPPGPSPKAVGQGAMLFDAKLGEVVYLNRVGEAWGWSGTSWHAITIGGTPRLAQPGSVANSELLLVAMGYDEGRDLLVLALPSATLTWDGIHWNQVAGGIDSADGQSDPHAVYDGALGQLVYLGAKSIWTWDGFRWQAHSQPGLIGGTLGYDPVRKNALVVRQDASACDKSVCMTKTWSWSGSEWSAPPVAHVPTLPLTRSGAYNPPMAFDESHAVMVLFATAT